jgi:hypothetical protein
MRENINIGISLKHVTVKGRIMATHCVTNFSSWKCGYQLYGLVVGTLFHMQFYCFVPTPGQTAVELARDLHMQQVLCVRPVRQLQKSATRFEGQLLKRSRFLGWKPIWVSFTFGFCHVSFLLTSLPTWWLLDHMRYNNTVKPVLNGICLKRKYFYVLWLWGWNRC